MPNKMALTRRIATVAAVRQRFRNWKQLLALAYITEYVGVRTREFTAVTRDGIRMSTPGWEGPLWPIIEMFATDDYRLKNYTLDSPRILDVGAHVGAFSVAACHAFDGARCVAFEPAPDTFAYLERNVVDNGLAERVKLMKCAVTGAGGFVVLAGRGVGDSTNRILRPGEDLSGVTVASTTLRDALQEAGGPVDLCKIDCEGAEYDIVASSDDAVWRQVRSLILEYHPWPDRSWSWLENRLRSAGFRVDARIGDSLEGIAWLTNESLY
jgi:FkbM family methyltransferase